MERVNWPGRICEMQDVLQRWSMKNVELVDEKLFIRRQLTAGGSQSAGVRSLKGRRR